MPGLAYCERPVDFENHTMLSPGGRGIECPRCGKAVTHAVCGRCGGSYTGELGIVESFEGSEDIENLFIRSSDHLSHIVD